MHRYYNSGSETVRPMSRSDLQKLSHRLSIADRCEQESSSERDVVSKEDIRELSMVLENSRDVNDILDFY